MSADRPAQRSGTRRGLAGRVLGGRYRVARMVSAGANTLIADAEDTQLDRPVTIKLVRPEWAESAEFRKRFSTQMRAMASLSHPNLAAVYDWGEEQVGKRTTVYAVVEYLPGGSLRDLFDRNRFLDPSQALMVGLEACRGLDFAHRKGLVHTELTPAKMVFGDDRRLRIVDFGLARMLGEHDWAEPATVATHVARYSSPEQALAQPIDAKTDIYSLALILVEAVTGAVPFAARSTVATLSARIGRLMPASADLGPLASVLERAGRPDPADRSTAAELGRSLVAVAEKLPRPKAIPLLVTGMFDDDPDRMRRPNDPTGGIARPEQDHAAIALVPPAPPADAATDGDAPAAGDAGADTGEGESGITDDAATDDETVDGEAADDDHADGPLDAAALAGLAALAASAGPGSAAAAADPEVVAQPAPDAPGDVAGAAFPPPQAADPVVEAPAADLPPDPSEAPTDLGPAGPTSAQPHPSATAEDAEQPQLYDGDTDLTIDELAALARPASDAAVEAPDSPDSTPGDAAAPEWSSSLEAMGGAPRRRRWLAWLVSLVVVVALAGLGYLAYVLFKVPTHEVPELVGTDEEAARAQTAGFDWEIDIERARSDEQPEVGAIIRTAPAAGERLAEGEPFLVVVSDGPELRTLPELAELPLSEAETTLAELRLAAQPPTEEFDEVVPPGSVISWSVLSDADLRAGDQVLPDTEVALVVSTGPAPRTVPDVAGAAVADVTAQLEELRLVVTVDEAVFSDDVPTGDVVSFTPAAGTEVERGSTVTLVPSKGVDLVTVPDLAGLTLAQARTTLAEAGLTIGSLLGSTQGTFVSATVAGEPAAAGDQFKRATSVDMIFL